MSLGEYVGQSRVRFTENFSGTLFKKSLDISNLLVYNMFINDRYVLIV